MYIADKYGDFYNPDCWAMCSLNGEQLRVVHHPDYRELLLYAKHQKLSEEAKRRELARVGKY
jgi:hypothetical protein